MITGTNSVFPFLIIDGTDGFDRLVDILHPELDRRGLKRLSSLLDGRCQCVVIERHYIDKDYRDTFSHFHSKRFSTPLSRCTRLHFFEQPVTERDIVENGEEVNKAYLGYSVVRPTKPNCIGRTLVSHRVRQDAGSHLCVCRERVMLLGSDLSIEGFPFISQDTDVTVCAESSLWMVLRYFSNRYPIYSEILPFQITNMAADHSLGNRVYPSSGLYSWQLAEALRMHGFSPVVYSRNQYPDNFEHLLYSYIESGVPLLMTVPQHVIVGYGHTSDFNLSVQASKPESDPWIYTSRFNAAFVVSDDNRHPYQMLHRNGAKEVIDSKFAWSDIDEFIVPLPERVFLTAEQAQVAIEALLEHPVYGIKAASPTLADQNLVLRLFLTSTKAFKKKLHSRGMGNETVESVYRHLPMPHFIWVCEIAAMDEYRANHTVYGEVIWDATRNAHEPDGWITLHLPEVLLIDKGSALNSFQSLEKINLSDSTSYDLFRSNLHTI
jgi:hypothetical protein